MWIMIRVAALSIIIILCVFIDAGYTQSYNDCGAENFQCNDGECIAGELLCDGRAHCKDKSDETPAECMRPEILCPDYAFRCTYGACVNGDAVCNNVQDCIDNSDETQPQCTTNATSASAERPVQCNVDEFICDNRRQCIDGTDVCDGIRHCADGSDEVITKCQYLPCNPTAFRCSYGACIDGNLRCNGKNNCADGSDEDPKLCNAAEWPSSLPTRPTLPPTLPPTSPTTPSRESCKAPPQPPNGQWKLHESLCTNGQDCKVEEGTELQIGSHLVYSCNWGYKIRGVTNVACSLGGNWLTIPVCTEIRCRALSTVSTVATCTYDNEWVSCETPALPGTSAVVQCRNSYKRETTLLTQQRDRVSCNENGQWEPEPIRCVPECGVLPGNFRPLITNGTVPNITDFPWHASLYRGEAKDYICGASIIQENLLITAAHCVYEEDTARLVNSSDIYVVTGNLFLGYDNPLHDNRIVRKGQVKNIYIVCNYLGYTGNYLWDIAILELVTPFMLSATLVPVCIDSFTYGDQAVLEAGAIGKVAGFGKTLYSKTSAILQALSVPYIPVSQCKAASQAVQTSQFITIDKFCAGYTNGSAVCDGDSGGGLVFKTGGLWYLRGVVSVSLNTIKSGGVTTCDNNLYSLYTRVSSHIGWIQDVIARVERNKTFQVCPDRF